MLVILVCFFLLLCGCVLAFLADCSCFVENWKTNMIICNFLRHCHRPSFMWCVSVKADSWREHTTYFLMKLFRITRMTFCNWVHLCSVKTSYYSRLHRMTNMQPSLDNGNWWLLMNWMLTWEVRTGFCCLCKWICHQVYRCFTELAVQDLVAEVRRAAIIICSGKYNHLANGFFEITLSF